ncbi:MAG: type II secretion system protein J [Desulfococcaceae bacterium]
MRHLKICCRGFSLIEMTVSLLLLGIVSAIWGMGIVQVTEGFRLSSQTGKTSQNVQACMSRLTKEFQNLLSLSTPLSSNTVTYIRNTAGTDEIYTVFFDADSGVIKIDDAILTDRVNGFVLTYYDTHDAASPLPNPADPGKVRLIGIKLEVRGADDIISLYENLVFLRGLPK